MSPDPNHSADRWSEAQAERYLRDLFKQFGLIADRVAIWRPIPASYGANGYFRRHKSHFIYWKQRPDKTIAIVAILHDRMNQEDLLRQVFNH